MSYTQLAQEERYQIFALKKAGHIQAEIAEIVGCDAVTQGLTPHKDRVYTLTYDNGREFADHD